MVKDLSGNITVNTDNDDSLFQKVLDVQHKMQLSCYPAVESMPANDRMLISTRALIHETIEIERELNWKHWKKPVVVNEEKRDEEIVDAFIFMMNIINSSGMSASELLEKTLAKIEVNIERQKTGY